jgi:hypothetical protein
MPGILLDLPLLKNGDRSKTVGILQMMLVDLALNTSFNEALPVAKRRLVLLLQRARESKATAQKFLNKYKEQKP